MSDTFINVECPVCSWTFKIGFSRTLDEEIARVVAGNHGFPTAGVASTQHARELDEANKWVDHICANCKSSFEYDRHTGEVRQ